MVRCPYGTREYQPQGRFIRRRLHQCAARIASQQGVDCLHEIRNLLLGEEVGAIVAQNAVMEYVVSDAAERNKEPILQIIAPVLSQTRRALEIGSGTGTHALHFSARLPHLTWQPTDTGGYL